MNADALRITEPPTLVREQAFERLRDAIITGHFKPGARLVERELCEAMGISRTSIREVLRRLESEKLIEVEPRRGPTVARVSKKQAAEIYEMRGMLEAMMVRGFTETASDQDIAALRQIYADFLAKARGKDVREIIATINRFNQYMLDVVDNELLNDFLHKLMARISLLRVVSMSKPGRLEKSIDETAAIMDAIERRDVAAAVKCVTEMVHNAGEAALEQFDLHGGEG